MGDYFQCTVATTCLFCVNVFWSPNVCPISLRSWSGNCHRFSMEIHESNGESIAICHRFAIEILMNLGESILGICLAGGFEFSKSKSPWNMSQSAIGIHGNIHQYPLVHWYPLISSYRIQMKRPHSYHPFSHPVMFSPTSSPRPVLELWDHGNGCGLQGQQPARWGTGNPTNAMEMT